MHQCFPVCALPDARVLVLGTLPGKLSLQTQQYYAQPRNVFWKIMGELVDARPELPYQTRIQRLLESGIALWDVYAEASREGSLDANIETTGSLLNDFANFLKSHPDIRMICFNGKSAATAFKRGVKMPAHLQEVPLRALPSTSPAHAAMPFSEKLKAWRTAMNEAGVALR